MLRTFRRATCRRSGFTLVEVLIAVLVLVAALSAFTRSMIGTIQLGRANRESAQAMEGARRAIERLYAAEFEQVYALFNTSSADDPPTGAPGSSFAVAGLPAQAGDADGIVGEVRFPTLDTGGALELREDVVDAVLDMPRDLNGDGGTDAFDHASDYRVLPVEVRVRWQGKGGEKELGLKTILVKR